MKFYLKLIVYTMSIMCKYCHILKIFPNKVYVRQLNTKILKKKINYLHGVNNANLSNETFKAGM